MYGDTLTRMSPLTELSDKEYLQIVALGRTVAVAPGEVIIAEGSTGTSFFILESGTIEVTTGGVPIVTLEPGAIFGEMALFNNNVRVSQAKAVAQSNLLEIETTDFWPLVLHNDSAAVKLMGSLGKLMTERLQRQDASLVGRIAQDDKRLASLADSFAPMKQQLMADWALKYHKIGRPGKLAITATKAAGTAADLSVAYSPGVAEPCLAIRDNEELAYDYTTKGQLVGVISNGTAVLGLGDIGALASKPVMEGKAILFKRFADIDAFDLEVDETDPDRLIDIVCAVAPTFGGINLEDIRSPECFYIEEQCQRRLSIPVFHDDQHGTAIIAGAGLLNALEIVDKSIEDIRVVFSGAGAAGFACAKYFLSLGVTQENLFMTDVHGVVYRGRGDGNYLDELAVETDARTLADAAAGADVFCGLSVSGVFKPEMLASMNRDPVVFAMANPAPEIDYPEAVQTRSDLIMATGRSDYPNQINNVSAFPYIFRGALDVRAHCVNTEMKQAASKAIAELARQPVTEQAGFGESTLSFGRGYVIPKPFDRRLLVEVASGVARAAMQTGVAKHELDLDEYREGLIPAVTIGHLTFCAGVDGEPPRASPRLQISTAPSSTTSSWVQAAPAVSSRRG